MAKKAASVTPASPVKAAPAAVAAAPAPALKAKIADPVAAAPVVEKSEVKGSGRVTKAPKTFTYDEIALRAYYIYANRGFTPGNSQQDWLEAERQLKAGL